MKKTILIILVLVLGLATMSLGSEGIWTKKAYSPTPRSCFSTSVVNGRIYAIAGGWDDPISTMDEYDPGTDTWINKADIPTAVKSLSTSVVNDRIYAIGGATGRLGPVSSAVQEYDPATDTWTTRADMPTARWLLSTSAVNGKVYAIGGETGYRQRAISTVEEYDPATDTWTTKADIPTARLGLSTSVVDGKIYAIGGSESLYERALPAVEEYDPATDTWTREGDMPDVRFVHSAAVVNSKVYVIGGATVRLVDIPTVHEYDPATDTWTDKADMPTVRSFLSASAVNNKIYAIGGATSWSTVEEYDPYPLVVDFNGDGIVDAADMCIMVDYWGTDDALCDIGPMPWGDGIVDVEDLKILAEHLFEEVNDPALIAHWALDETEGAVAYDSAGVNDAFLDGDPVWQPDGGMVAGALQFDGVNDYVSTDPVLNPADGVFSVVTWIKGGAPGQAVISQTDSVSWLCSDSVEGCLMTEFTGSGRSAYPLMSQAVITDGKWHRIGLVWDGSHRTLCVDGAVVAEDVQNELEDSNDGLYIGCGKSREPGSFFSGLIDDVRIYKRIVIP